jgi:hypothetical protein
MSASELDKVLAQGKIFTRKLSKSTDSWVFGDKSGKLITQFKVFKTDNSGVQGKNNEYHNVNKGQNSFIDTLIFDLINNVVFVVFTL